MYRELRRVSRHAQPAACAAARGRGLMAVFPIWPVGDPISELYGCNGTTRKGSTRESRSPELKQTYTKSTNLDESDTVRYGQRLRTKNLCATAHKRFVRIAPGFPVGLGLARPHASPMPRPCLAHASPMPRPRPCHCLAHRARHARSLHAHARASSHTHCRAAPALLQYHATGRGTHACGARA